MAVEGLISVRSSFGHAETMPRAETAVRANGMAVYARIDHAPAAAEASTGLRPTAVLFFGTARVSAPLVEAVPSVAIDLPLTRRPSPREGIRRAAFHREAGNRDTRPGSGFDSGSL